MPQWDIIIRYKSICVINEAAGRPRDRKAAAIKKAPSRRCFTNRFYFYLQINLIPTPLLRFVLQSLRDF